MFHFGVQLDERGKVRYGEQERWDLWAETWQLEEKSKSALMNMKRKETRKE